MACAGCVLSDPPEHGRATQTPPILYPGSAIPAVLEVLSVKHGDREEFNIAIRSEDVGEDLLAELWIDYSIVNPAYPPLLQKAVPVAAGKFEDDTRAIDFDWDVPTSVSQGCHHLTLVVTHNSNLEVRNPSDIATVTWWVNVNDSTAEPFNALRDCPKNTGATN
jgi:hypothetical protein